MVKTIAFLLVHSSRPQPEPNSNTSFQQFGHGGQTLTGDDAFPSTTTLSDATLVPIGTASQGTTFLYVEAQDEIQGTTSTFVASASGNRVLATGLAQACHYTASDSGECEVGRVQRGVTQMFTTTGDPFDVVAPISASGEVESGSNASYRVLGYSGSFGAVFAGVVAGVALALM
uniref:Uncharacterized protein n=1 Tax=Moniliophthora roreri TaxID=221103 RepID=A0A0W0F6R1_MONRR